MRICKNDIIVVPKILQNYVVNWYHTDLSHMGTERTNTTISQHYYWTNLRDYIRTHIKVCNTFQKNKKQNLNNGKLLDKEAEAIPWYRLSVDLIDPYKIMRQGHNEPLILKYLTMIDPATTWFEIVQYNYKQEATKKDLVQKTWLCRYLRPTIITYYRGNEFLCHALKNPSLKIYRIKAKGETTENPQAN